MKYIYRYILYYILKLQIFYFQPPYSSFILYLSMLTVDLGPQNTCGHSSLSHARNSRANHFFTWAKLLHRGVKTFCQGIMRAKASPLPEIFIPRLLYAGIISCFSLKWNRLKTAILIFPISWPFIYAPIIFTSLFFRDDNCWTMFIRKSSSCEPLITQ